MGTQRCSGPIDAVLAAVVEQQHGVVARRQLVELGVGDRAIHARLARGTLIPLHRGVYAFGHRQLRIEGRWLAAVLAAGDGAVLSHRDAAALHGMRKPPESRKVSVSTRSAARGTPQLWVYRRRRLDAEDVATVRGIPATSPARTLVDLAPMLAVTVAPRGAAQRPLHGRDVEQAAPVRLPERRGELGGREKTNRLQLAGHEVLRFMHGDLVRRPDAVARTIRAALAAGRVSRPFTSAP